MNIAEFPKVDKTVDQRRRGLIMFLENNPHFQDSNYISIWFKMTYEFIKLERRIAIVHQEFQKYDRTVKPATTYMMSFSNPKKKQTKQKAKMPIITYEEENVVLYHSFINSAMCAYWCFKLIVYSIVYSIDA